MDKRGQETAPYDEDVYGWAHNQAALLREGRFEELDIENVAEEIESLGRSQAASLKSSYRLICLHLLKVLFQPERMTRSWQSTILRERLNAQDCVMANPSLKPRRMELFAESYAQARKLAATETGLPLSIFPDEPAFDLDQAVNEDYTPWVDLPR